MKDGIMHQGPVVELDEDNASRYKSILGVKLFVLYCIFYGGFVLIATFAPELLHSKIIFGLNLAITYGFGLIIFAIILGLIYNHACKNAEKKQNTKKVEQS